MTITLTPDVGVPLPDSAGESLFDFDDMVHAAAETAVVLGLDTDPTVDDMATAEALSESYAADPEKTSKVAKPNKIATMTPASLVLTRDILDEFGQQVVTRSVEIRHLVTNKLILESENPDARIRMRALELLGKITDVGLFTERTEVTITHQSTEDLKNALREKLQRLKNPIPDAENTEDIEDGVLIEGEIIDIEADFGVETPAETEKTTENPAEDVE